jgi:replicative DNA helicase
VGNAVMDVVINFGKQELGIPSGFEHLDMYTGGLKEGNLIIIAARPSMGKTAFATNIALNVAADPDRVVAMFSLEMSQREVLKRTICSVGLCSKDEILAKNERATKRAVEAAAKISDMKLFLDDRSSLSVGKIKARCMQIKQKMKRLDLVIVDYLQLVNMKSKKNGTREQEVAEATRGFKLLAKELNCPLILLSQLSREVERRNDRTPILSDLRESGAIEQDADIVIFLHRPHQVDKEADPRLGFAIIAKNRNGATDTVQLDWQGEYQKFSTDWTRDAERAAVVESLI